MNCIHKNITITGTVQGVGFRFNCKHQAQAFGIKGFVKNGQDGTVYIEAEGTLLQIHHFIQWCYKGPPHARVNSVNIEDGKVCRFKAFDIKR